MNNKDNKQIKEFIKKHSVIGKKAKTCLIAGCALLGAGTITLGSLYTYNVINTKKDSGGETPTEDKTAIVVFIYQDGTEAGSYRIAPDTTFSVAGLEAPKNTDGYKWKDFSSSETTFAEKSINVINEIEDKTTKVTYDEDSFADLKLTNVKMPDTLSYPDDLVFICDNENLQESSFTFIVSDVTSGDIVFDGYTSIPSGSVEHTVTIKSDEIKWKRITTGDELLVKASTK